MPIGDRDWERGSHPPYCTCVECCKLRLANKRRFSDSASLQCTRPQYIERPEWLDKKAKGKSTMDSPRDVERPEQLDQKHKTHSRSKIIVAVFLFLLTSFLFLGGLLICQGYAIHIPLTGKQISKASISRMLYNITTTIPTSQAITPIIPAAPVMPVIPITPIAPVIPITPIVPVIPTSPVIPTPDTTIISVKPIVSAWLLETQIHNLINIERQQRGFSPLEYDYKLAEIARNHSIDMANNNYFSHDNLIGQSPTERAKGAGYNCYKSFGSYYVDGIAENIFQNWLYDSITYYNGIPAYNWNTQDEIANSTVDGWMNSSGHRENILNPTYSKEGIGVAISNDDKVLITEDFW